jgi:hypothetical protein
MKKIAIILFWAAILLGLVLRYMSLSYMGIFDMATYHEWGLQAFKGGLIAAYEGIYYPFQYQLFELGAGLSIKLNTDYFIIYKIINLLFDFGNLIVLYLIFKKISVSKYYLLLYWLHPWFLIIFTQGYCDFQFTFFILCFILFTLKSTSRNYLIAGIFFGFALFMKPQVQVIALTLFIYGLFQYFKNRDIKTLNIFVFPAILFINYSLYFFVRSGHPLRLLRTFLDVGGAMPLTANFLNGWFPIAYYINIPGDPIYSVNDDIMISNISFKAIALLTLLLLLCLFIHKLIKNYYSDKYDFNLFLVTFFSTFIFPFVMTSAHENHLFLATVLFIPVLGKIKNLSVKLSIHVLLILQCINLYGFYGYGENKIFSFIKLNYTYEIAFFLSLIALSAFLIMLVYFLRPGSSFLSQMKESNLQPATSKIRQ